MENKNVRIEASAIKGIYGNMVYVEKGADEEVRKEVEKHSMWKACTKMSDDAYGYEVSNEDLESLKTKEFYKLLQEHGSTLFYNGEKMCENVSMKKHYVKLSFLWDEGPDESMVIISTSDNVSAEDIQTEIEFLHNQLDEDVNDEDIYGCNGRNAETLLNCMADKMGWTWEPLSFDVELELN